MKSRTRQIRVAAAALTAVALVALVGVAGAGAKAYTTSATLSFQSPDNFSGEVSSTYKKCKAGRLVTLYFTGMGGNDTPEMVEAAKTDTLGHYEINAVGGARAGNYNVVVSKRLIHKRGKVTKCRAFTSASYTF